MRRKSVFTALAYSVRGACTSGKPRWRSVTSSGGDDDDEGACKTTITKSKMRVGRPRFPTVWGAEPHLLLPLPPPCRFLPTSRLTSDGCRPLLGRSWDETSGPGPCFSTVGCRPLIGRSWDDTSGPGSRFSSVGWPPWRSHHYLLNYFDTARFAQCID